MSKLINKTVENFETTAFPHAESLFAATLIVAAFMGPILLMASRVVQ